MSDEHIATRLDKYLRKSTTFTSRPGVLYLPVGDYNAATEYVRSIARIPDEHLNPTDEPQFLGVTLRLANRKQQEWTHEPTGAEGPRGHTGDVGPFGVPNHPEPNIGRWDGITISGGDDTERKEFFDTLKSWATSSEGLRDKFAMAALQGVIARYEYTDGWDYDTLTTAAYKYADAMMKARIQRTDSEPD